MPEIRDGVEYWSLAEAAGFYLCVPQTLYLRQRTIAGHPRSGRVPGLKGLVWFKADEIRAFAHEHASREPTRNLFGSAQVAVSRGAVLGAHLNAEGEASVQALQEEWLRLNGAGRQDELRAFLASLEAEPANA